MIIHAISDLHGHEPSLPGGELLIIAGDCTTNDFSRAWENFVEWLETIQYDQIILVAGNHDGMLQKDPWFVLDILPDNIIYLQDNEMTLKNGLRVYGSPWTPNFADWHFMLPRGKSMQKVCDRIPQGIDILVTHGPAMGILDKTSNNEKAGCDDLRLAIERVKPKIHLFGHIHENGGKSVKVGDTHHYNVSCVDECYDVVRGVTEIKVNKE